MNQMDLLEFIFPKKCVACRSLGSYLCQSCTRKIEYLKIQKCAYCYQPALSGLIHPKCRRKYGLDGVVYIVNYKTPIRELIKSLKYRYTTRILAEFENRLKMDKLLVPNLDEAVLVTVPMYRAKQNSRGFNQAELLGKMLANNLGIDIDNKLVEKTRSTISQVGLSQKERIKNVKNAFSLTKKLVPNVDKYIVFDDVWTSGSTLKEVSQLLKKAGAKEVWGLTLAHRD